MTARITGSIRPQAQFADAEVRASHIASNKALGIRDIEGNVSARAEARLWRSPRSATSPRPRYAKDATPVRAMAALGHTQHWGQHTILCVDSVEGTTVYAETVHVR